jgi:hypothetical protein
MSTEPVYNVSRLVQQVACSTCGARRDELCVREDGEVYAFDYVHEGRIGNLMTASSLLKLRPSLKEEDE